MRRELTAAAGAGAYVPSTGKGHPKSALDQHCKKNKYICIYIYINSSNYQTYPLKKKNIQKKIGQQEHPRNTINSNNKVHNNEPNVLKMERIKPLNASVFTSKAKPFSFQPSTCRCELSRLLGSGKVFHTPQFQHINSYQT